MMVKFAKLADETTPVRMILVGAGGMGKNWMSVLSANPHAELVGVVDLDLSAARSALVEVGLSHVPVATSVSALAAETGAHAVVNVTVPAAHHPVNVEALFAGLPVLCEKPAAPTVSQALSLAASAEVSGQLLMISQSRRYFQTLSAFKTRISEVGDVGLMTTEFYKGPHFGGFREDMDHVLLIDMAIHAFDVARYLLGQDPVAVYCDEFNPSWSWYRVDAAATAVFEMSGGTRYLFNGSWCSGGLETSWNGNWRVSGSLGSARWDGHNSPTVELVTPEASVALAVEDAEPEQIAGSLAEFIDALRTGKVPSGEIHSNVLSLAMVEAAIKSAESRQRVTLEEVLTSAYDHAVANERNARVRAVLEAWASPADALRYSSY